MHWLSLCYYPAPSDRPSIRLDSDSEDYLHGCKRLPDASHNKLNSDHSNRCITAEPPFSPLQRPLICTFFYPTLDLRYPILQRLLLLLTKPLLGAAALNDLQKTRLELLDGWHVGSKDTHVSRRGRDVDLGDLL